MLGSIGFIEDVLNSPYSTILALGFSAYSWRKGWI
jgi:hypothetical protein